MICEKARQLHDDLVKKYPGTSGDTDVFKAGRGWFEKFKKRSGIHSVVRHWEAASANQKAAEEFVQDFSDYVKANGFLPQQVLEKNAKEDRGPAGRKQSRVVPRDRKKKKNPLPNNNISLPHHLPLMRSTVLHTGTVKLN